MRRCKKVRKYNKKIVSDSTHTQKPVNRHSKKPSADTEANTLYKWRLLDSGISPGACGKFHTRVFFFSRCGNEKKRYILLRRRIYS